ncbi:MAG: CHAD domain-containing protein [Lamprobacter sp.]|uniref:CHAD domain-containing protein n=1 Tax=Lamprobacter sp. TaxID=3100796 RepID=UPI002B261176|nr:CHAD domain-containing protein [Lamprobacter sp.]MEA3641208.1 CHAD domain-containing protein [Lamprobacter sp.]
MTYELDPAQPLDAEVRRIATERIDHAVAQIDDAKTAPHAAVHEVRKDCKKLRALLRLVRPAVPTLYKDENAAFREIAASLSVLRDAEAAIETFDALIDPFRDHLNPASLAPLRHRLEDHKAQIAAGAQALDEQLEAARTALLAARKRVPGWALPSEASEPGEEAGWSLLGPGLRKTYKRGRGAIQAADAQPSVATFHEWRKRAKYLRYQVRLLRASWPRVLKATYKETKQLGDLLGDDHDLAVLEQVIEEAEALNPSHDAEQLLLALAAQRSEQLRKAAMWLGSRLYAEKPKRLERRMRCYWRMARVWDAKLPMRQSVLCR